MSTQRAGFAILGKKGTARVWQPSLVAFSSQRGVKRDSQIGRACGCFPRWLTPEPSLFPFVSPQQTRSKSACHRCGWNLNPRAPRRTQGSRPSRGESCQLRSQAALLGFVQDFEAGRLEKYLKSAPWPRWFWRIGRRDASLSPLKPGSRQVFQAIQWKLPGPVWKTWFHMAVAQRMGHCTLANGTKD